MTARRPLGRAHATRGRIGHFTTQGTVLHLQPQKEVHFSFGSSGTLSSVNFFFKIDQQASQADELLQLDTVASFSPLAHISLSLTLYTAYF